jgi:hypothetical protein
MNLRYLEKAKRTKHYRGWIDSGAVIERLKELEEEDQKKWLTRLSKWLAKNIRGRATLVDAICLPFYCNETISAAKYFFTLPTEEQDVKKINDIANRFEPSWIETTNLSAGHCIFGVTRFCQDPKKR